MTELSRSGLTPLEVARRAVMAAGEVAVSHFGRPQKVESKGRGNLVTEADKLAEKAMIDIIRQEYPQHNIVSEESEPSLSGSVYTWFFDPIDGTNNYYFGLPFFAMTASLARGDEILLGLVYDPLRRELFWAEKGKGAFLNDSPVSVGQRTKLESSLIGLDLGYSAEHRREVLLVAQKLWVEMHSLRVMGSAALGLAYVAAGRFDLYFHRFLFPWDLTADILLINEAGGLVTDWEGRPAGVRSTQLIAANRALHGEFIKLLRGS
jgi:myo-inositol-1(or 4)-monophosphatase